MFMRIAGIVFTCGLVSVSAHSAAYAGPPEPAGTAPPIVAPANAPLTNGVPPIPSSTLPRTGVANAARASDPIELPLNRQHVMLGARLVPNVSMTPSPRERAILTAKGLTESSPGARQAIADAFPKRPTAAHPTVGDVRVRTFAIAPVQRTSAAIAASAAIFNARTNAGISGATQTQSLNTTQNTPPQIANVAVDGSYQNKSVASDQMLTIDGAHFEKDTVVKLRFPSCSEVALVTSQQSESRLFAKVPSVAINLVKAPAQLIVINSAGESNAYALTYLADLDLLVGSIHVWPYPFNRIQGGPHAEPSGFPLVEGSSMSTSGGNDRESIAPGWLGGQGGSGTDNFFTNVMMLNDWRVVDNAFTALVCDYSTPKDLSSCNVGFLASPVSSSTGLLNFASTGALNAGSTAATLIPRDGGSTNPTTVVTWSYDANHEVSYVVGWAFLGPHGKRPMSIMPKLGAPVHGGPSCED